MATLQEYWAELAKKNNLSDDVAGKVLEALKDEAVQKVFTSGFKTISDYSRDLDKTRDATKKEVESFYSDWHQKADAAYRQNLAGIDELNRYRQTYGGLDNSISNPDERPLTRKELTELIQNSASASVNIAKQLAEYATDYVTRFHKRLNTNELEKLALQTGSLELAYNKLIEPEINTQVQAEREKEKTEWEAKLKAAREEGAKDALSRVKVPIDTKGRTPHPFFDRKEAPKDKSSFQMEQESRDEFIAGFEEALAKQ